MINDSIEKNPIETSGEDIQLDSTLRPLLLSEYIGQESLKKTLSIIMEAAKHRNEQLEHLLFYGPPGLGKTTLAMIIARELGKPLKITSGPAIEKSGDLASLLTSLETGDVLFIDEIHRLHKTIEEILYPAMEDKVLDIMIGKGAGARSIRMELPPFTLIGATTRIGSISAPLRDRFGASFRLDYYETGELQKIVERSGKILGIETEPEASLEIAQRSRLTPRIANRLLRRVRDFVQVRGHDKINHIAAKDALEALEIDSLGLDKNDRNILTILIEKFNGGPVGVSTLAAASGEEIDTISDVHEPFLMRAGLIARTPQGRVATDATWELFNKVSPKSKNTLL